MSTAHNVLTQVQLFSHVVSFQSGAPGWLVHDLRPLMPPGCTRYRNHLDKWVDSVIDSDDRATLERFVGLLQPNDEYWKPVITLIPRVLAYAIKHNQLDFATQVLDGYKSAVNFDPSRLLCAAIESGSLEAIKWVHRHVHEVHRYYYSRCSRNALHGAVRKNALDVVQWVLARRMHDTSDRMPVRLAARLKSPEMFRLLLGYGFPLGGLLDALEAKSIGCVQELIDRGAVFDRDGDETMEFIASADVSMLRFLRERDMLPRTIPSYIVEAFIEENKVEEVKFLLESKVIKPSAAQLYHSAEYSTDPSMLRLLLRFSPRGCLLKASNIARRVGHTQIEEELDRWVDPDVTECESRCHGSRAKRRRCQKENVS